MLTLSSIILGTCLVNASRDVYDRHLVETTSIVLEHSNTSDLKKILYNENEVGIKDNIKSKNMYLNPVLRMINIDGSKTEDRKKRREINKCFMKCLIQVEQSIPASFLWLKRHVDYEICEIILSDWNYKSSFLQVMSDKIASENERIEKLIASYVENKYLRLLKISYEGLKTFLTIASTYLDLTLDCILLYTIIAGLGPTLTENLMRFSSVITILLLVSILVPTLSTAISISFVRPLVVLDQEMWNKWKNSRGHLQTIVVLFVRFFIILFFPFVPAIIMISSKKAKEDRKNISNKYSRKDAMILVSDLEESESITKYVNESRLALLTFKRNELSIELIIQLSIHLTMVFLSQTVFPIESSLEAIFQSSNEGETQIF